MGSGVRALGLTAVRGGVFSTGGRGGGGDGGKVSLLIRGISERTSVGELRKVFERYGSVKVCLRPPNLPKGCHQAP